MHAVMLGLSVALMEWVIDFIRSKKNRSIKYLKDAVMIAVSYGLLNLLGVV